MVVVVALRTDPECVPRSGGGPPFLQTLDMYVLREKGERRGHGIYRVRFVGVRAKTYAYRTLAKTRSDQSTKFFVGAVETYSTLWRPIRRDIARVLLVRVVGALHACQAGCATCKQLRSHCIAPPVPNT